jgi:hypothetical protein
VLFTTNLLFDGILFIVRVFESTNSTTTYVTLQKVNYNFKRNVFNVLNVLLYFCFFFDRLVDD